MTVAQNRRPVAPINLTVFGHQRLRHSIASENERVIRCWWTIRLRCARSTSAVEPTGDRLLILWTGVGTIPPSYAAFLSDAAVRAIDALTTDITDDATRSVRHLFSNISVRSCSSVVWNHSRRCGAPVGGHQFTGAHEISIAPPRGFRLTTATFTFFVNRRRAQPHAWTAEPPTGTAVLPPRGTNRRIFPRSVPRRHIRELLTPRSVSLTNLTISTTRCAATGASRGHVASNVDASPAMVATTLLMIFCRHRRRSICADDGIAGTGH